MSTTTWMPDGSAPPADRAELLRRRAAGLEQTEKALFSFGRMAMSCLWMLVGAAGGWTLARTLEAEGAGETVGFGVATVALVGVAGWQLVRRWRWLRSQRRLVGYWLAVDRLPAARALPAGEVDEDLMTTFDSRDLDDRARIADNYALEREGRVLGVPLGAVMLLGVPMVTIGMVLVLMAADPSPDDYSQMARWGFVVAALFVFVPATVEASTSTLEGWRRQQDANRVQMLRRVNAERARVLHGTESPTAPRIPQWVRLLVGAIVAGLVLLLGLRLAWSSPLAVLIAVGILAVLAGIAAVPVALKRRLHVVPLLASVDGEGSVLQEPARWVTLEATAGAW